MTNNNCVSIVDVINCITAIIAIIISIVSLIYSYRNRRLKNKPYINLKELFFEPDDFHIYSKIEKEGFEKLTPEHEKIIKNTIGEVKKQNIDGKDFLLINILNQNYNEENVQLVLAPYQFSYENTGGFCHEINIIKAKIIMNKQFEKRVRRKKIDYLVIPSDEKDVINIKVAYVCCAGDSLSVVYDNFKNKSHIDFLNNIEDAKKIINFTEEIYTIKCKNNANEKFKKRLIFSMDENGLKYYQK